MEIKLRAWAETDVDSLVKYANNSNIAKFMTDGFPHPYTYEDGLAFIKKVNENDTVQVFAIEVDGKKVGGIGLHLQSDIYKKNAELGYWLAQEYWGKRIISTVIPLVVQYGFDKLPINRIFARPFGSNIGSQRVLEKSGFTLEGRFEKTIWKNGSFEDELVYAIRTKSI